MFRAAFDKEIARLTDRVIPLERFVHALASRVEAPVLFKSVDESGFRYTSPDVRQFCLLRCCRIVSALNASIGLARLGHTQEIAVLLRTVIEYTSQAEYVLLNRNAAGDLTGKAALFVASYFQDDRRTGPKKNGKRIKLRQEDVHDAIGTALDELSASVDRRPASELMSHVYTVFSNYVHGRYPETMDLFGGRPGSFHLNGMRGTPKDDENIETLDTLITSASNCLIQVAQGLQLWSLIESDKVLADWYRDGVSGV